MDKKELRTEIAKRLGIHNSNIFLEHKWKMDDDIPDQIDIFVMDSEMHNGPGCERCGYSFCHHCDPEGYTKKLPCIPSIDYPDWPNNLHASWKFAQELIDKDLVDPKFIFSKPPEEAAEYICRTWLVFNH